MTTRLSWGILGTGAIARTFAKGVAGSRTGRVMAVGSRSQASADTFGEANGVANRHGSYEALLADPQVEAVYISLPHTLHAEWAIRTAEAGKHILCEKPIGLNHAEAMRIVEAAQRHRVFLMEAFMYRCHPQTERLLELLGSGAIGDLLLIQAPFAFKANPPPDHRLVNHELAGGGILDVGCYAVSMANRLAGAALGGAAAEPLTVQGAGRIGPTRVDEYAVATLTYPRGIIAQLVCGVKLRHDNVLRLYGSGGSISVPSPWIPAKDGGPTTIVLHRHGEEAEELRIESPLGLYALEADAVADHLAAREAPQMPWADTLSTMRTLDRWREAIGLVYDVERPERLPPPARPLAPRIEPLIPAAHVPGVEPAVSRLVMGVDNQSAMPHAAAMFDDFVERGGTCFDTAYVYGGGQCERIFGQWMERRGLRARLAVIGKGAHTPFCTPEHLTRQLHESLERLRTGYVDLYLLHRDNPDVPVDEFVDVLDAHRRAGRIRAYGGSNWSLERVDAANAACDRRGIPRFAAVSNNLSLARMVEPVWAGCVSAGEPAARAWFARTQTALFAWSSQARGFFTDRARPDDVTSDPELARCWYREDNWRRRARVIELAQRLGVEPINVALAWVLHQPFPTFALIGPRTLAETRSTVEGLRVRLSPQEVAWLDLQDQG